MGKGITISDIKQSACWHLNKHLEESPVKETKPEKQKIKKRSVEKGYIHDQLGWWCKDKGYNLLTEHQFHPYRKFRFDWAIKELMIAFEYHGLNSAKSGHTTMGGFTKDADKANLAQAEGWKVLVFTLKNYKTVIQTLEKNI
jgi:hypothetical protein